MRLRTASASDDTFHLVEGCRHEWHFVFPRIDQRVRDTHETAQRHLELERYQEGVKILTSVVSAYPEYVDAQDTLAWALKRNGEPDKAYETWKSIIRRTLALLPSDFYFGRDHLLWGYPSNWSFLQAYLNLGSEHRRRGLVGEALSIFQNVLYLDPSNVRAPKSLIVRCFFRLHRPLDVLAFCERHHDDYDSDLLYGRALALYQLGRKSDAAAALEGAIRRQPSIAKELAKQTHRTARDDRPRYNRIADEAIFYWREAGEFWSKTRGALALVRRVLRERDLHV
ncbi:MAG TPA: tetratricopeptide repeat protein [Longimicrobium sp.]|nr:tetratricopeptide repeat protein [Longimicrobium sp.]